MRKFLTSSLLLAGATLLALFLLEGALRLTTQVPESSVPPMIRDKKHDVTLMPPNLEATMFMKGDFDVPINSNQYGLRDSLDVATARRGDILAIGDSYTMGWGVREGERWSSVLASELGTRVFNLAMPANMDGYADYLGYAARLGSTANTVVFGICMENDLLNYSGRDGAINRNQISRKDQENVNRIRYFLGRHSRLYQFVKARVYAHEPLRKQLADWGLITKATRHPAVVHIFDADVIEQSAQRLLRLTSGLDAYVLIIPSRALWFGGGEQSERKIHDTFVSRLRELGLRVTDMRPLLEASGDPKLYHFKHDGHWTAAAHKMAGKAIADTIRNSRVLRHPVGDG